jgi:hypothetical protein
MDPSERNVWAETALNLGKGPGFKKENRMRFSERHKRRKRVRRGKGGGRRVPESRS